MNVVGVKHSMRDQRAPLKYVKSASLGNYGGPGVEPPVVGGILEKNGQRHGISKAILRERGPNMTPTHFLHR